MPTPYVICYTARTHLGVMLILFARSAIDFQHLSVSNFPGDCLSLFGVPRSLRIVNRSDPECPSPPQGLHVHLVFRRTLSVLRPETVTSRTLAAPTSCVRLINVERTFYAGPINPDIVPLPPLRKLPETSRLLARKLRGDHPLYPAVRFLASHEKQCYEIL